MELDIASAYQELGIDTKQYNSGTRYVACPQEECSSRRKKNQKTLMLRFSDGYYECFHCHWKGFAKSGAQQGPVKHQAPVKKPQKFLDEPVFNWIFPDTTIDPVPADPKAPSGKHTVTFYMRNAAGKITGAKKMVYNFENKEMRRDKEHLPLFTTTRDEGYYPCLFYESDLREYPNAIVLLVESEKTAAMLRHKFKNFLNEFIYLATGGAQGLSDEKIPALKKRDIWIVYDCDNGELQPDGTVKNPRGREGAESAQKKLEKIANSRVIDIDPKRTDGTDLADILREVTIEYIRALPERIPTVVQELWDEIMMTQEPPEDVPIIRWNGFVLATLGNISLLAGKKKTRKTLLLTLMASWFLSDTNNRPDEMLFFDTEQGKSHVWKVRKKIHQMTGHWIPIFFLRGKSYDERRQAIQRTVQYWPKKLKWIIIDGVRDLIADFNSIELCTDLLHYQEVLTVQNSIHITNVLHHNKTDGNPRGHLGTELANKAETNFELALDEQAKCTVVTCESSRDLPFESFAFTHGANGLPELVDVPIKGNVITQDERRKRLITVFDNNLLTYQELLEGIQNEFSCALKKSKSMAAEFRRSGWIAKDGTDRDKHAKYKLLISENGQVPPQRFEHATPKPDLFNQPAAVAPPEPVVPSIEPDIMPVEDNNFTAPEFDPEDTPF